MCVPLFSNCRESGLPTSLAWRTAKRDTDLGAVMNAQWFDQHSIGSGPAHVHY